MQTTKPYRTPLLKLVRFFQSSRDGWKAKYLELKQLTRRQDGQVRSLQRSRDKWKQEASPASRNQCAMDVMAFRASRLAPHFSFHVFARWSRAAATGRPV